MKHKLIGSILLALAAALLVWAIAVAKSPCQKGWEQWWHELGNGRVQCQCYKKEKPPKNPEWHRGCPVSVDPSGTPDPDGTPGPEGGTPVPQGKNSIWGTFAKITRLGVKEYHNTPFGTIPIYWIGDLEAIQLCTHAMDCYPPIEPPSDAAAINLREHRGTLFLGMTYEPGTYWVFAKSASGSSGNETAQANKLIISK